jgi:hypothetical protein
MARRSSDSLLTEAMAVASVMILAWRALIVDCKNETAAGSDPRAIY